MLLFMIIVFHKQQLIYKIPYNEWMHLKQCFLLYFWRFESCIYVMPYKLSHHFYFYWMSVKMQFQICIVKEMWFYSKIENKDHNIHFALLCTVRHLQQLYFLIFIFLPSIFTCYQASCTSFIKLYCLSFFNISLLFPRIYSHQWKKEITFAEFFRTMLNVGGTFDIWTDSLWKRKKTIFFLYKPNTY